jgi:hypothetical protein
MWCGVLESRDITGPAKNDSVAAALSVEKIVVSWFAADKFGCIMIYFC